MFWKRHRRQDALEFAAATDVGLARSENEDAYGHVIGCDGATGDERLFVVADGMGGLERGREASHLAVETVRAAFCKNAHGDVTDRMEAALRRANERVFRLAQRDGGHIKMGTTCTALALTRGHAYLAHVGDSRAYRVRGSGVDLLTRDHTWAEELRREGVLTAEQAQKSPRRHALTRGIGIGEAVEVDRFHAGPARPGDHFVLCTDGLKGVTAEEIGEVVRAHAPPQACERLVQMANNRGGLDNVTVLVIRVRR